MTSRTLRRLIPLLSAAISLATPVLGGDWPNFRGPNHDGISPEKGIRTVWKEPMPLVWERKVGPAFSSFACVGDRVYTCGTQENKQVLFCLNAKTGDVIWQTPFEAEYPERQGGDGTRATPTVDGGNVYILGARGTLLCVDAAGKEVWKHEYKHIPQWGYSGSVLIEGDLAISSGGHEHGALAAYDKKTGKEIWKSGEDPPGYATPYPFTFDGKRYIVGFTGTSVIIVDPKTGKQAWKTDWETNYQVNAAAPIFSDGHLFISSGYRTGCAVYKLTSDAAGLAGKEVWRSKVLMNKFQSCVLYEGKLYASDQKSLVCADFLTGKEHWRKVRAESGKFLKDGTVLLAEGHLIVLTEDGQLLIAKATPDGFDPVTSAEILDKLCWTVPVIHDGRLYARNLERLVCFKFN